MALRLNCGYTAVTLRDCGYSAVALRLNCSHAARTLQSSCGYTAGTRRARCSHAAATPWSLSDSTLDGSMAVTWRSHGGFPAVSRRFHGGFTAASRRLHLPAEGLGLDFAEDASRGINLGDRLRGTAVQMVALVDGFGLLDHVTREGSNELGIGDLRMVVTWRLHGGQWRLHGGGGRRRLHGGGRR